MVQCRRMTTEASVGIIAFATPGDGFLAATKQRFSDFIVHEIDMSGNPVRLTSLPEEPPPAATASSDANDRQLAELIGDEAASTAYALQRAAEEVAAHGRGGGGRGGSGGVACAGGTAAATSTPAVLPDELVLPRDDDKEHRTLVHRLIKQLLPALVSDTVDAEGGGKSVRLMSRKGAQKAAREPEPQGGGGSGGGGGGGKRRKLDERSEWPAEAGTNHYLGFTLYKENRDSGDAIGRIARGVGVGQNHFFFAGTKDKRGVTTQRVNVHKLHPWKLAKLMAKRPFGDSIVVGDLRYEPSPLRLGAHGGNQFTVVLRDVEGCEPPQLEAALTALKALGFVNYFGLQRFGTNPKAGTHMMGAALLRSDFHTVCDLIMSERPGERDDERHARQLWASSRNPSAVLKALPHRMRIERSVLEGLEKHGATNPLGALSHLPRQMRSMYLHAFQSLVFNHAASERVRLFGCARAVAGDLVAAREHGAVAGATAEGATEDRAGSEGAASALDVHAADEAAAAALDESVQESVEEGLEDMIADAGSGNAEMAVHVVTEEEAAAGMYSVHEVLLPLPTGGDP